jgi:hypothetical protein
VARVAEVLEAEGDRILARGGGELVHERFAREMQLRPDRIAQVRGAQRRVILRERRDRLPREELVFEGVGLLRRAEDPGRLRLDAERLPDQAVGGLRLVGGDVLPREALCEELVGHDAPRGIERGARAGAGSPDPSGPSRAVGAHALHAHGLPMALARYAASSAASPASLRPYEPGPVTQMVRTFSCGMPRSDATPSRTKCGFCEPDHTVHESPLTSATAQAGPMQACDWNGHSYSASTMRRPGCLNAAAVVAHLDRLRALHRLGAADVIVQLRHLRERVVGPLPVHLQRLRRAHRVPLARREHRDEIALAEHAHAGDALDRRLVHASHLACRARRDGSRARAASRAGAGR